MPTFAFAPQTRGSTRIPGPATDYEVVCPADAGVYPTKAAQPWRQRSLPRRRGGLPVMFSDFQRIPRFAPQTRGSTAVGGTALESVGVCPADAGVYHLVKKYGWRNNSLPRRRGGLPPILVLYPKRIRFAPQTRGSTVGNVLGVAALGVCCCARTRGGLPFAMGVLGPLQAFAPHTRGSTLNDPPAVQRREVCPAHAGVYPSLWASWGRSRRLPRTRWGSTLNDPPAVQRREVCPAHAGVYPRPHSSEC